MGLYQPFQLETLAALGIDEKKVIFGTPGEYIVADCLIVPSIPQREVRFSQAAIHFLRRNLLKTPKQSSSLTKTRLYISRKKANVRRIVNEDEIIQALLPYGFQPVCLEDLSVQAQAELFHRAEIIIGPHGAGLTNLIFCSPQAHIIEIFNYLGFSEPYRSLSAKLRLYHHSLLTSESSLNVEQKEAFDIFVAKSDLFELLHSILLQIKT
jgi:capsular polysaccharide biosynthesis protein